MLIVSVSVIGIDSVIVIVIANFTVTSTVNTLHTVKVIASAM